VSCGRQTALAAALGHALLLSFTGGRRDLRVACGERACVVADPTSGNVSKGGCYRDRAMYSSVLSTHDFTSMVGEPLYVALEYIM
jgi:hypothetical protein